MNFFYFCNMKNLFKALLLFVVAGTLFSCSVIKPGSAKEQRVMVKTTEGNIKLKLYNETPLHRDNFVKLVKSKFYDGILFHRVIDEFMIQAGDPESKKADADAHLGSGGTGYTVPAEFRTPNLYHKKGTLAAARQGDNINPNKESSGSQFYIVVGKTYTDAQLSDLERSKQLRNRASANDSAYVFSQKAREDYKIFGGTPALDADYTVFGEVVEGLEIVDKISKTETGSSDRPKKDIRILKMRLTRK